MKQPTNKNDINNQKTDLTNLSDSETVESSTAVVEPTTQQPITTKVIYSNLRDESELISHSNQANTTATDSTIETYQIINDQLLPNPKDEFNVPVTTSNVAPILTTPQTTEHNELLVAVPADDKLLHRQHKSEQLTDRHILSQSKQQIPTNDTLVDDKNATGITVEHMGVALKQWIYTLHWQRADIAKSGFINKLKKRTQPLDLDLSCLLCNRYGEVQERVWFKNVRDQAESIRHQGDELLGVMPPSSHDMNGIPTQNTDVSTEDSYDPQMNLERIAIYLDRIPPHIFHVVLLASSYHNYPLNLATDGYCELSDDEGNTISKLSLASLAKDCSAVWFATLTRIANTWRFNAEHQPLNHHEIDKIANEVSEQLVRTAK